MLPFVHFIRTRSCIIVSSQISSHDLTLLPLPAIVKISITIFERETVNKIWKALSKWCTRAIGENVSSSLQNVMFNNYKGSPSSLINLLLVIFKPRIYIFATRCKNMLPNFISIMSKVTEYKIEKNLAYKLTK